MHQVELRAVVMGETDPVSFSGSFRDIEKNAQNHWETIWKVQPKKAIGKGKPEEGIPAVWTWPEFPIAKQKLVDPEKFDPRSRKTKEASSPRERSCPS